MKDGQNLKKNKVKITNNIIIMNLQPTQWKDLVNHTIIETNFIPKTFIDTNDNDSSIPAIDNIELVCKHNLTNKIVKFVIDIKEYSYSENRFTHYQEVTDISLRLLK